MFMRWSAAFFCFLFFSFPLFFVVPRQPCCFFGLGFFLSFFFLCVARIGKDEVQLMRLFLVDVETCDP